MNSDNKKKTFSWKLTFSDRNVLGIRVLFINAPTLGDALINLHDYLKPSFIASNLISIEFNSVVYE